MPIRELGSSVAGGARIPAGRILRSVGKLLQTGAWDGDLTTSRWVQVECKDRAAIHIITEALQELEKILQFRDGQLSQENRRPTGLMPSKSARFTIAGLAPTTTEVDIKRLCSQYGRVEKIMVHYPENEAVTATVVMADHLEAVNMRLDLDGKTPARPLDT